MHMIAVLDSDWAILIVVAAVVIFFGGGKLPKLFHSLGSAQAEFKKGLAEGDKSASEPAASDAIAATAAPAEATATEAIPPAAPGSTGDPIARSQPT